MATIPIEVIVQDAEAPIVPSEDGTNTNITVPDTGTISSNGDTSSSVSSIVLPAILLVLAIGSIVAILIHKYHKQKKDKTTRKEKLAVATSSTIAILAVTVLIGNLVLPATKAATSDVEDGVVPSEDKVSIVVTRDGGVAEESIESTATITSTSDFGYKVLLSMAGGVDTSNLYLDGDETSEHYIAPVEVSDDESEAEGTVLAGNTWGYALTEDGEYSAIPLLDNAAIVVEGDEPVEDEVLGIYYGVKVSSDLPNGTYSGGEVEYTLESVPGFPDTLVYMQDMTPEICAAAPTPGKSVTDPVPTATLEDIRDHNTYTIAKLADGKCWMTQNLDLDIEVPAEGSIVYDSTNTNLTVAGSGAYENGYTVENGVITWAPANATIDFTGDTVEGWESSNMAPYSANPGDVYYYTSGSAENDTQYNLLTDCVAAGHTAEDCKHYHAGNYYNWNAAVASNDTSSLTTQYDNAANSICPAGWRLPNGPNAEDTGYNEMFNAINSYEGIVDSSRHECGDNCIAADYLEDGFSFIRTNPLWLIRAGIIYYGGLSQAGSGGHYRFSTVETNTLAYSMHFDASQVFLADSFGKYQGITIRCVAE